MPKVLSRTVVIAAFFALFLAACTPGRSANSAAEWALLAVPVRAAPSPHFERGGRPFCFAGTNNYYLGYQARSAVTAVLEAAARLRLSVVRTWAFLDMGSLDGTTPHVHEQGKKQGVYFQYWDPARQSPAYNDGPDGLAHLDFVLSEARRLHLTLILTLTNNWRDFGGMDQYLRWFGLSSHADFYADERARVAYKAFARHLIERVNSIDGVPYRDDPALLAWELANEPRLANVNLPGGLGAPEPAALTRWADEMSAFVKALDPNHLVSVGDEGFAVGDARPGYQELGSGVDHQALTALPHVDFGTVHLYPDHWGWSLEQAYDWISRQQALGHALGKPTVLEEYGLEVERAEGTQGAITSGLERRQAGYRNFNQLVLRQGGAGALFWHLAADVDGAPYPDYDQLTVYPGDASATLLSELAGEFSRGNAQACAGSTQTATAGFVRVAPN